MASPYPDWAGDQGPHERHVLRGDRRRGLGGDLAHVNGQVRVVPVPAQTIDALAAFEAEGEDWEDEPVEAQGDDELAIVNATWI